MRQALIRMNLQLHRVVSDITVIAGMKSCARLSQANAIPHVLGAHRDGRSKASANAIRDALTPDYRPEHISAPRQAVELHDAYQANCVNPVANYYEERDRRRAIENLRRRADALGFSLIEATADADRVPRCPCQQERTVA